VSTRSEQLRRANAKATQGSAAKVASTSSAQGKIGAPKGGTAPGGSPITASSSSGRASR
jgi:hypothetical protein